MGHRISRRTLARVVVARLTDGTTKPRQLAKSLAAYLIEYRMTDQLEMLISDIAHELAGSKHQVYAEVSSAHELSNSLQQEIAHFLREAYDVPHVELNTFLDPELIGGMIVKTSDAQLDTSVRSKLQALGQA
jgi:F-type H+-transporting ATPase subunit delta